MSFGRDFSNFSFFIKKHLNIFDRQVFYKLTVADSHYHYFGNFFGPNFLVSVAYQISKSCICF
jgi:hypothetical protein